MKLRKLLGAGALAGSGAGLMGALTIWLLVEPILEPAIALEGSTDEGHGDHTAPAVGQAVHEQTAPVVSRGEQVVGGMLTVLVVGVLIGVVFAIVYRRVAHRLPGAAPFTKATVLAALGFVAFTLAPALVLPANPPGVGDPATVGDRTLAYVVTIVGAVAVVCACFAIARRTAQWALPARASTVAAVALVCGGLLLWAMPTPPVAVPEGYPADLLWDFRLVSLAQLGLMWAGLGILFGWLIAGRVRSTSTAQQALVA